VGEWRHRARTRLADHGIESAAAEADLLVAHVLGLTRLELTLARDRLLSPAARTRLARLLGKRLRRVPIQYLVGEVDFAGVRLRVGPGVLIPRPETEGLVERVAARLGSAPATAIDVGTGSGAIALALAVLQPRLTVWGTDVSPAALRRARQNARRLGLAGRVRFSRGDLLGSLSGARRPRDLIAVVSNPPYVAREDRKRLPPEVRNHEPGEALFAGRDGLAVIVRLLPAAAAALPAGGLLALEIGEDQGARVRALLRGSGDWEKIAIERDLAGRDRYALALRSGKGG
jgi:release factor glutamine methyltransferase